MPRFRSAADWDDDDPDADDWDDGGDSDLDDESTIPCPSCRRDIHEDAQRCPYCQRWLSAEDAPATRKPWWILVGAALALYAALRWVVG